MPKRKDTKPLSHETKMALIKEGRAHAIMLSNVLKALGYFPKTVDKMMGPAQKTLDNIEESASRDERKRREAR